MVRINVRYEGDLHCSEVHEPSGAMIQTDAPKDNQGRGEAFSPTDLVAAALGSCMMTIMGIYARRLGIDLNGARCDVTKHMSTSPPRIGRLEVHFKMPAGIDLGARKQFEKNAMACPVHHSLHPKIEVDLRFDWK